jgi:3-phosphoshikimate 1-carboxyvinyltransferase
MSLAVLGALGAGIELDDPGSVSKTCPDFFEYLTSLGIQSSPA